MTSTHVPPGSIVVGVDGSADSAVAVRWGADQAALEGRHLALVHCLTPPTSAVSAGMFPAGGVDYGLLLREARAAAEAVLDSARNEATASHEGLDIVCVLEHSDPRSTLVTLSSQAHLLVLGARGRGPIATMLLGSVSVYVSKHAACPVVVCRPGSEDQPRRGVLVGVDGQESSRAAIEFAYHQASWRRLPLTVQHCYWEARAVGAPDADAPDDAADLSLVAEAVAGMQEKYPDVLVQLRLERGFVDQVLIEASYDHDLVVVGYRPLRVLHELLHVPLAPAVLENAHGAVAVVPAGALLSQHDETE